MNNQINATEQLELGFNGVRPVPRGRQQRTRLERAAWWFAKMRAAVDDAVTWGARPTPPPQQIWFAR